MNTMRIACCLFLAAPLLAAPALAASGDEMQEATALLHSKVTLIQAIAAAERHTGGKAFDAGVDIKAGIARISVETNGPKGVQTSLLDARSGQVIGGHDGGETD